MPVRPVLGVPTVWQAMARPDKGSWNQTVLELPLVEVPIGKKLGFARIWEFAAGRQENKSAPTAAADAMMAPTEDRFIRFSFKK